MLTFVRHGEKLYDNGKGEPKLDPVLTDHFQGLTCHPAYYSKSNLVIYSSPYKRCQQTALKFGDNISYDCRIAEFLGYQRDIDVSYYHSDIHDKIDDIKCLPPVKEKIEQMRSRMLNFCMEKINDLRDDPDLHIIVVTHGYPIQTLFTALTERHLTSKHSLRDGKKGFLGVVEGFTISLYAKHVIPTRFYSNFDRDWCDNYDNDSAVPLSEEILDSLKLCECDAS